MSYVLIYENTRSEDGYVGKLNDSMSCIRSFSFIIVESSNYNIRFIIK